MEYIFLGIDSFIVSTLYYFYKNKSKILTNIKNAPELDLSKPNDSILNNNAIDYCMVVGRVKPDFIELPSQYNTNISGVVWLLEICEHGTKWRSNIAFDTNRLVTRVINDTPFSLKSSQNPNVSVKVETPLDAEFLVECLDLTYKSFEPSKQSLFSKIVSDLTLNETVRGVETTEKMLRTGTEVTVFGRVEKLPPINDFLKRASSLVQYRVSEPTIKDGHSYIITPLSRQALINRLSRTTRTLRICLIVFGIAGVAIGAYCAYKAYIRFKNWLENKKRANELAKARLERLERQRQRAQLNESENERFGITSALSSETPGGGLNEQSTCVVCLTNPRELVLLDCGHVCLCMDCFERLSTPNCPICRQRYRSFMPCYLP